MSAAVEAAAKAIFEDPNVPAEYTWAEMVVEDPSRADIWREDARRVVSAALPPLTDGLNEFIDGWYDRWAGPGESWTAEDLATAITEELKRRIEA